MPFCTNCGNEITPGARFCGSCGKEQPAFAEVCPKCNKKLKENENFCSNCGTTINVIPNAVSEKETEPQKPTLTKEGKKIIDAGPVLGKKRPAKKSPVSKPATKSKSSQKKKRSPVGCFFRTIFILASVVIGAAVLVYVINIFIEDNENTTADTKEITANDEGQPIGTDIPGIVDIEPGDVSHLPENKNQQPEQMRMEPIVEGADIKKAAKTVEDAFVNADIAQIKLLLTESGLSTYSGILEEIQPHLAEYGNAFKNRKLITSTDIYQVYEFYDEKGEKFTAAFELQPDGNWKLTRF